MFSLLSSATVVCFEWPQYYRHLSPKRHQRARQCNTGNALISAADTANTSSLVFVTRYAFRSTRSPFSANQFIRQRNIIGQLDNNTASSTSAKSTVNTQLKIRRSFENRNLTSEFSTKKETFTVSSVEKYFS